MIYRTAIIASLCTLLYACGGGGSGGGGVNIDEPAVTTLSISGTASKGIITNARVVAYPIINGSIGDSAVLRGTTDEQGRFILEGDDPRADMLLIKVTGDDNNDTTMQCDLVDCGTPLGAALDNNNNGRIDTGEWQGLSPQFELEAIISDYRQLNAINVNLATHIVAKQLQAGTLSPAALQEANQFWQNQLGLSQDFTRLTPVDISSSFDAQSGSDQLIIASVLRLVSDEIDSINLQLADLNNAAVGSQLLELVTQNPTALTSNALAIANNLDTPSASSLLTELQQQNQILADAQQLLEYADLPKLPPVL